MTYLADYLNALSGVERDEVEASIRSVVGVSPVEPKIVAKLAASLYSEVGPNLCYFGSTLTFSAAPTVVDCWGILRDAVPGEALFYGARRVENLLRFPEHLNSNISAGWSAVNGLAVAPVIDPRRPGRTGRMTAWKLSRSATASSVLRTTSTMRRRNLIAGLDLLLPLPHIAAINIRRANTNVVNTAEIRVYTSGGGATAGTQVVTITDDMETYGVAFTPVAPKRVTGLSWSGGVLTVTAPAHGYTNGNAVRLSGSIPAAFDVDASVSSVPDADTFTVPMAANPGSVTTFGWTQPQYVFSVAPGSWASTSVGDIEVEMPYVSEMYGYPSPFVPEYVARDSQPAGEYWHGAAVDGVRYYDTAPGWVLNATTGRITQSVGEVLSTCKGVTTYAQTVNAIPRKNAEAFAGWTKSDASVTVTDNASVSPTGNPAGASRIVEGTHTGRHYVELPAGLLTNVNTSNSVMGIATVFVATPGGSAGRDWMVYSFTDRNGAEVDGYVNLATGAEGTQSAGLRCLNVETLGTHGGLSYRRVHLGVRMNTGSGAPTLRIGLASADNVKSYAGGGSRYIVVWGASYVGTTINRPTAAPYGRRLWDDTATLAGAALVAGVQGLLGTTNFTVASRYTPYYSFYDPDRVDWTASTYGRCAGFQNVSQATGSGVNTPNMRRVGQSIRPNLGTTETPKHLTKFAFDHYADDPTGRYVFEVGKTYGVGDYVVPTTTQPNNATNEKVWEVTVGGVAGAEPSWPTVSSLPSATVTSGGVTFQVIHDNGILGSWEPYNGAQAQPPSGFMAEVRNAWFLSTTTYGAFLNGVEMEKQTEPAPVNPDYVYSMPTPLTNIWLGQLGPDDGVAPRATNAFVSVDLANLMPRHTASHRNLAIWDGAQSVGYLKSLTAT